MKKWISILVFLSLFHCGKYEQIPVYKIQNGFLDLSAWNPNKVNALELNGDWLFYWEKFVSPNNQTIKSDSFIPVPGEWQNFGYPVFGYASYQLFIKLPKDSPSLSLDLKSIACSYELYINGELVAQEGKVGKSETGSTPLLRHRILKIKSERLLEDDSTLNLIFYVSNFQYYRSGLWDTIRLGTTESIEKEQKQKFVLDIVVLSSLFIMGLYHLGLYLNRRKDKSPLYFALFCIVVGLRTFSINERLILETFPDIPFIVALKLEYFGYYASGFIFLKFVESLFPMEVSKKVSVILSLFFIPPCLLVIFTPMGVFGQAVIFAEIGITLGILYVSKILIFAIRNKRMGARLFLLGFLIIAISAIHDILKGEAIFYTPYILGYGLLTFIIFQATILSRKFAAAFTKSEELTNELKLFSERLEVKVEERTFELNAILETVQELKNQQDGDYFLTSLLLRPLNSNKSKGELVKVDFFSSQKKKFQFKEWKEEIGGDLCMANNIILKDRSYTVFVNADAMGKSLQGASGALVFGSVFESIINRNIIARTTRHLFPEKWIKDAFVELHHVFETFDGSMLVSLVLGLIDDQSGLLYLINADHPPAILFRDGKASFLNIQKPLRKLGTLGANEKIRIFTFQLSSKDVIIFGSDGRDDLLITHEDGTEMVNENDSLILNHVERTNGDLEKIYSELLSFGKQYDDITFIKVSFSNGDGELANDAEDREEPNLEFARELMREEKWSDAISQLENLTTQHGKSKETNKLLFYSYLRNRDFHRAKRLTDEMLDSFQDETEVLFQISYLFKKIGDYNLACDLGERVKLREPEHIRNLILLSDLYNLLGNEARANQIIDEAKKIEPNHPNIIKRKY